VTIWKPATKFLHVLLLLFSGKINFLSLISERIRKRSFHYTWSRYTEQITSVKGRSQWHQQTAVACRSGSRIEIGRNASNRCCCWSAWTTRGNTESRRLEPCTTLRSRRQTLDRSRRRDTAVTTQNIHNRMNFFLAAFFRCCLQCWLQFVHVCICILYSC